MPNFIYGLSVYGASEPDLNILQNSLDRCHERCFISYPVSIKDLFKTSGVFKLYASAYTLATLEISSSSPKKNLYIRVVVYSTDKLLTLLAKVQLPFWKTSEFFANLAHIWLPWVPEGFFPVVWCEN